MRPAPQNRISNRALPVWRISAGMTSFFGWLIVIGIYLVIHFFNWPLWIFWISLILVFIETIVTVVIVPKLRWKRWRYEVHEHEIDIQQGVFVVKRTLVPMKRVQHVDTKQGPILRAYRLATVTIFTAATVHEIPALDIDEADELRDRISKLLLVDDHDV